MFKLTGKYYDQKVRNLERKLQVEELEHKAEFIVNLAHAEKKLADAKVEADKIRGELPTEESTDKTEKES